MIHQQIHAGYIAGLITDCTLMYCTLYIEPDTLDGLTAAEIHNIYMTEKPHMADWDHTVMPTQYTLIVPQLDFMSVSDV